MKVASGLPHHAYQDVLVIENNTFMHYNFVGISPANIQIAVLEAVPVGGSPAHLKKVLLRDCWHEEQQ